jgi:hypothetical protein
MASQSAGRLTAIGGGLRSISKKIETIREAFCPAAFQANPFSAADMGIAAALATVAAAYAVAAIAAIDPRVYDSWNIYFHADGIRVLSDMTDRFADHWRTNAHPLVPALTFPLMHALMGLGLSKLAAASTLMVSCAAGTTALLYLALRGLGVPGGPAVIFMGVFLSSATFVHWFAYIETYAIAALTIAFALFVLINVRSQSFWMWTVASAGTLAITITNWGLALAAGFFRLSFANFLKTAVAALILVGLLTCVQKLLLPSAAILFNPWKLRVDVSFTQIWLQSKGYGTWTPVANVRGVLLTSAVAPPPVTEIDKTPVGDFTVVSNLRTPVLHMSPLGLVATAGWILMLGAGVWGVISSVPHRAVTVPIIVYVAFQVLMHSVYGEITFLYAGNFFPALFLIAALGYFTPLRKIVLSGAVIVAVLGGLNNYVEFARAARLSGEVAAHLAATGTAICVPTCQTAPKPSTPVPSK